MGMSNKYGLPASQTLGTLSGITTASDAEERKKRRQTAFQTPGGQGAFPAPMAPAPTFARMQQNGEARPAPPGYAPALQSPMGMDPFPQQATLPAQVQSAVSGLPDDELLRQRRMLDVLGQALGLTSNGMMTNG